MEDFRLPCLWDEGGQPRLTHKLLDNWEIVKVYLRREKEFDPDGDLIPQAERILKRLRRNRSSR
jgi:hypothetical protein